MDVPVQQLALLGGIVHPTAPPGHVAGHDREGIAAPEDPVVVDAEPGRDQVEQVVDRLFGLGQTILELGGGNVPQAGEHGLAGQDGGDHPQQPLQPEVEAHPAPLGQQPAQAPAGLGPLRTYPGQGQVSFGELGAPRVDPVEDVDDHVDGLVLAHHLLDMQVDVLDLGDGVEAVDVANKGRLTLDDAAYATLHQGGDVDPQRVVGHLGGGVELEDLVLQVEVQAGEDLGVALEEPGRDAPDDAVEGGDALLAVEEEPGRAPRRRRPTSASDGGRAGRRHPHQQAAHRVLAVQRGHEAADLLAVPDVAPLELGQGHIRAVYLV